MSCWPSLNLNSFKWKIFSEWKCEELSCIIYYLFENFHYSFEWLKRDRDNFPHSFLFSFFHCFYFQVLCFEINCLVYDECIWRDEMMRMCYEYKEILKISILSHQYFINFHEFWLFRENCEESLILKLNTAAFLYIFLKYCIFFLFL